MDFFPHTPLNRQHSPKYYAYLNTCLVSDVSLAGHRGAGDVILDRVAQCQSVWTFAIINKRRNYVFAKTVSVTPRARLEAAVGVERREGGRTCSHLRAVRLEAAVLS